MNRQPAYVTREEFERRIRERAGEIARRGARRDAPARSNHPTYLVSQESVRPSASLCAASL